MNQPEVLKSTKKLKTKNTCKMLKILQNREVTRWVKSRTKKRHQKSRFRDSPLAN